MWQGTERRACDSATEVVTEGNKMSTGARVGVMGIIDVDAAIGNNDDGNDEDDAGDDVMMGMSKVGRTGR
jgi:hypothetical protein